MQKCYLRMVIQFGLSPQNPVLNSKVLGFSFIKQYRDDFCRTRFTTKDCSVLLTFVLYIACCSNKTPVNDVTPSATTLVLLFQCYKILQC